MISGKHSVLIVNSSLTVRMELARAFEQEGWKVKQAATLAAADKELKGESDLSLMILDSILPDGDAAQWLTQLRESEKHNQPVILLADSTPSSTLQNIAVMDPAGAMEDLLAAAEKMTSRQKHVQKILLIDDSLTYREELREALEAEGYSVITAANGEDGLALAIKSAPQAAIVDNILPGMDGITVLRRMRQEASLRRTPLLLLTASGEPEQELRALEAGADSFVRKDQEVGVILAMLAAILRSASAPAAMNVQQRLTQTKKVVFVAAPREHSSAIAAAVREEGYELGLAGSLTMARELIRTGGVDCLLVDSSVPQHDVVTVIREVKDSPLTRNTRIILVGESEAREELIHAISAGADDYLPRSSGPGVWKARLHAHVRRKQLEDENQAIREHMVLQEAEVNAQRQIAEMRAAVADELRKAKDLAEEKAREAERLVAQSDAIFKSMAEGILLVDPQGKLIYANDAALRMFEFENLPEMAEKFKHSQTAFKMCNIDGVALPPEQWPLQRAASGETVTACDILIQRLDTDTRFIGSLNITPIRLRDGAQILSAITIRDITEQKKAEDALRRTEKLAATGRLAASIAHEINNPLAAVTNLLYILKDFMKESDGQTYLDMAQKELSRVSHITKQTLAFYRETNTPVKANMNELMAEVIEVFAGRIRSLGLTVETELRAKTMPRVFAGEVRQVMTNLVSNAVDASEPGGKIRIRVHEGIDAQQLGRPGVSILVQDYGKGIPLEIFPRLFQPFISTKGQKGTGLGLWVSHSIVERHEGSIRFRSSTLPHRTGTCFRVFFPNLSALSEKSDTIASLFREVGRELLAQTKTSDRS